MGSSRTNRYLRDIPLPGLDAGPRGYRAPAVCKVVGITYRQLDYWTTTGLVSASVRSAGGSGSQRLYAFDDVVTLKVIKRLLDTGISLRRIRDALEFVRDRGLSLRDVTLMSDGTTIYAVDDDAQIIDLMRKGQGVFGIAVGPLAEETEAEIMEMPGEPAQALSPDEAASGEDAGAGADTGS